MYQLIYNLQNTSNPNWLTDQYSNINTRKPFPTWSCQKPVNINSMFNKLTLRKNLLCFMKLFYYLISFNIVWNFTYKYVLNFLMTMYKYLNNFKQLYYFQHDV